MSSSNFRTINAFVDKKSDSINRCVPDGAWAFDTDHSGIILIAEPKRNGVLRVDTLDRISVIVSNPKDTRRGRISKSDIARVSEVLNEQARKLEALASTYKLMALAMSASADDFPLIMRADDYMRRIIDNPFE